MEPLDSQHSQSILLMGDESSPVSSQSQVSEPQALPQLSPAGQTFSSLPSSEAPSSIESQRGNDFAQSLQTELQAQKQKAKVTIESLVLGILDAIAEGRSPMLQRPRLMNNSRDIRRGQLNPGLTTKIVFGKRSHRTFAMQIYVMSLVYRMIQQNQTSTLRDLYYESMNFFGNQSRLSGAIKELSLLLKVPREALCLEASAKGLVAGSISFKSVNGDTVRALDFRHGVIVPNKLHELTITTDAQYILFVEKDATFQRLLDENVFNALGPIILITGKGYPDMQTRRLMCILNRVHQLKVYALVDCDPYGIEIAAVVKWGSYRNASDNNENENYYLTSDLSVPDLVWLGLLPSEQPSLSLTLNASAPLTDRDRKKLDSVAERIELQDHEPWLNEVRTLQQLGRKTELEALFSSPMFTSTVYLPSKLFSVHPSADRGGNGTSGTEFPSA